MKTFLNTMVQAFNRMDGIEQFAAIILYVAMTLFIMGLIYMGGRVVAGRVKAYHYHQAFERKKTNRFKADIEREDFKDAVKSVVLVLIIAAAFYVGGTGL